VAARVVEPEWLDTLPPRDPRAERSRRDLARLNAIMANARIVASLLDGARIGRVAEIGAGDGAFASRLAGKLGNKGEFVLLDRQPAVAPVPAVPGWQLATVTRDVFEWLEDPATGRFDAIIANLFLHHFDDAALGRLLELVAPRTTRFAACEPRRSGVALAASRAVGWIGCNDVTRHDAVASVRAGFTGREISHLWTAPGWSLHESRRGLFSHAFVAIHDTR
jgi:hypothetical protein